jgi:hypothetical protein
MCCTPGLTHFSNSEERIYEWTRGGTSQDYQKSEQEENNQYRKQPPLLIMSQEGQELSK